MSDHVHLCLSIPPSTAWRTGLHSWARGYCVSTVGLHEKMIREYIRNQEEEEKRQEQLPLGGLEPPSSRK